MEKEFDSSILILCIKKVFSSHKKVCVCDDAFLDEIASINNYGHDHMQDNFDRTIFPSAFNGHPHGNFQQSKSQKTSNPQVKIREHCNLMALMPNDI